MASKSPSEGASTDEKPAILIIGGLGYIGRFLALYIHDNKLASEVRLVDKVLPQLARLPPEFSEACHTSKFMQADASRPQSNERIFTPTKAKHYTYVFNCGAETRYSQDPSIYDLRNTQLSKNLATYISQQKPPHKPSLVEFSTGMIYKPPSDSTIASGGCTETAQLKPWLKISKAKLKGEETLEEIAHTCGPEGLNYATLRLGHVYGRFDTGFLARGLCIARVYQHIGKEMKWLWGKSLRVNTVHIEDVCTAAWAAAQWASLHPTSSTSTQKQKMNDVAFNITDDGDLSQEKLASLFHTIFAIETGFQNTLINQFAKMNLDAVVGEVNEEILQPWADLLKAKGLNAGQGSPLSPFMEKELIKDCDLSLNNGKAKRELGWVVREREMTAEGIRGILRSYEGVGWWP
ncbi:MAG: hypothetical protein OHK93_007530 [Ramalina farinacea]|uniref:NAD-dependent epimerase/dehydratase domain-containing protein n=1 Tax=Ramalina farinacea TaxID=258253 RepID=A0AA43QKN5_9LECA|nr:hypothetical protein [Ramalina farinacea]